MQAKVMIDLHGKTVKETKAILAKYFVQIIENNITEFYIITGRGNHVAPNGNRGVLKKALPRLLKPYTDSIDLIDAEIGCYKITLRQASLTLCESIRQLIILAVGDINDEIGIKKHLAAIELAASKNDPLAIYELAVFYLSGMIPDYDNKPKGIDLLNQAKDLGLLEADVYLGVLYLEGSIVKGDYQKALLLFRNAGDKGSAAACLWLAKCYMHGQGIIQDDQLAFEWIKKAADYGDMTAEFNLGYQYFNGGIVKKDDDLAFYYLVKAGNKKHPQALVYLGRCYANGYGTTLDSQKAFSCYLQAAELNDPYALCLVGQYYMDGRAGQKDPAKAFQYFMRGAQFNDGDCQYNVAYLYIKGEGVPVNLKEGGRWLEAAAKQNNLLAHWQLSLFYRDGIVFQANPEKRLEYLKFAANGGIAEAQIELAYYYFKQNNQKEGDHWIQEAEKNDFEMVNKLISTNSFLSVVVKASKEKNLRNAANSGDKEQLEKLLHQPIININAKDDGQYGRTALHWAVIKQALPCIKLLLAADADAIMVDNAGKSSVDYAAESSTADALFILLSHQYKLPLENIEPGKLLRRAAHQNKLNDVKLLLKHIKDVNAKDLGVSQRTALHWAVIQESTDCIEQLMMAGAEPHLADGQGKTALDYANEKPELLLILLDPEITQAYIP